MLTCIECGCEIDSFDEAEIIGMDGDFIHKKCRSRWNEFVDRINTMSDDEFYSYMRGGPLHKKKRAF